MTYSQVYRRIVALTADVIHNVTCLQLKTLSSSASKSKLNFLRHRARDVGHSSPDRMVCFKTLSLQQPKDPPAAVLPLVGSSSEDPNK